MGGGTEQKGKTDMDNSVVIAGGRGYERTTWSWKNITKITLLKNKVIVDRYFKK